MSSARSYLNVYTPEAMAKTLALRDEQIERLKAENAKLHKLVRKWYPHMLKRVGRDALEQWGQMEVVRELGIEVGG